MKGSRKSPNSPQRLLKIAKLPGFRYLVDTARERLGLLSSSFQVSAASPHWKGLSYQAGWTIMDLFELSARGDEVFVMNAIACGVDEAVGMVAGPTVAILVPEVPRALGYSLAVGLLHVLWPKEPGDYWINSTEGGRPSGTYQLGVPYETLAPATISKGPGVIAGMLRNGPRIYMDVTDASKSDIINAIPAVTKIRKELKSTQPTLRRGAPAARDEERAVEAARLHRAGESLVNIGKTFGWRIYTEDVSKGTCPTAVRYVQLGEEILTGIAALDEALAS